LNNCLHQEDQTAPVQRFKGRPTPGSAPHEAGGIGLPPGAIIATAVALCAIPAPGNLGARTQPIPLLILRVGPGT